MLRTSLIAACLLAFLAGQSQPGNLKDSVYLFAGDTVTLDRAQVFAPSVVVFRYQPVSDTVSSENYTIHENYLLPIRGKWPQMDAGDSIRIIYRTIPGFLTQRYFRTDTSQLRYAAGEEALGRRLDLYGPSDDNAFIQFPRLDYGGSFSRGFSVGNNQSLVLNSALNLQMHGDIGDGIELAAVISDNNIPIQPEGNTRQIQEFDKVFIQLTKQPHSLVAGDFDVTGPSGHFMRYHKKLKGLQYRYDGPVGKGNRLSAAGGAAISRGKFARNTIRPREGNQGPYKLSGSSNEQFIIVLPATERVFVDGVLQERGREFDYVIDYNRGEITFTSKTLITRDKRIIVEFEYAEQSYIRTHTTVNGNYETDKTRIYFNLYSELDGKNANGDLQLDTEDKLILRNSGDNLQDAFRSTIQQPEEGYSSNRIMYAIRDTTADGIVYQDILVYSNDPETALYTANFSRVGQGNGNYVLVPDQAANGRVYAWVAPDPVTGRPQGDHAPVARLLAPESRQMFNLGTEYTPSEDLTIQSEVSLSHSDLNRFSPIDDGDNTGMALLNRIRKNFPMKRDWQISLEARHEFVQRNFSPLNPYRNAEFARDWDIDPGQSGTNEHLPGAVFRLEHKSLGHLSYCYQGLYRNGGYQGTNHGSEIRFFEKGWELRAGGSLLNAEQDSVKTTFFRPVAGLKKTFGNPGAFEIGTRFQREENRRTFSHTDSLSDASFSFDVYEAYAATSEDADFHVRLGYSYRVDRTVDSGAFVHLTNGQDWKTSGFWIIDNNNRVNFNFSYRNLEVLRTDLTEDDPANTAIGKLDYLGSLAKGALRLSNSYELGTGREPRVEYQYIRVQPGEGSYIWVDDGDGVEELNEFEIAPFPDEANYIRVTNQNDAFISTRSVAYNQSLRLNLQPLLYGKGKTAKFFSRFALLSTIKFGRKNLAEAGGAFWNPLYTGYADTALVSLQNQWRNILYFNQSNPSYDIQFGQTFLKQLVVQTIGLERRDLEEYFTRLRWNITRTMSLITQITVGERGLTSERFQNRDYQIDRLALTPELTYLVNSQVRLIGKYSYSNLQNTIGDHESATIHDLRIEGNVRKSEKFSIRSSVSFARVNLVGEGNSGIEFALLEGLKPGGNVLWNAQIDVQLSKAILLTVQYDGRRTGENPVVHTGNVQLRASF